jgi:diguanylate cyclase (GGDEF)-like protein
MFRIDKYQDVIFATMAHITSLTIGGTDKLAIFEKLIDGCLVALEAERIYLLEMDAEAITRYWKSKVRGGDEQLNTEVISETPGLKDWLLREMREGESLEKGQELAFDLPMVAQRCLGGDDGHRLILSAPIIGKKSFFGLLLAIHEGSGGPYTREDEQLITVLANQAAIVLENHRLYQKLEKEAVTDGLTGVYNYRFLMTTAEKEIQRARRFRQSFSFVMMDVDNLKEYNDKRGHLYGSEALKEIAAILKDTCRQIDFVSKYGGDEFGIILPQTELEGATTVTERAIEVVANHVFEKNTKGLLTCSAGISLFPTDGDTVRDIVASADKALYEAKRRGKNMVLTTEDLRREGIPK